MNRTVWIIIGALCIIGLGGLIYANKKEDVNVDTIDPMTIINATEDKLGDNVYGKRDSKVIVFEYADFQCGGCAAANGNLQNIKKIYAEKVAFVFRNFPLTSGHPNALAAATVAEAAGFQGKYWEMNNLLYTNQMSWTNLSATTRGDAFTSYAQQLELNIDQFKEDLKSDKIQRKIQTDRALAGKVNVNATPTLFVNGVKMNESEVSDLMQQTGNALMDKLDQLLKDNGETPPERTAPVVE